MFANNPFDNPILGMALKPYDEAVRETPHPKVLGDLLTLESVEVYKRWDCQRYLHCLDLAIEESWVQFHCNACNAYIPDIVDNAANRALARIGKLLQGMASDLVDDAVDLAELVDNDD